MKLKRAVCELAILKHTVPDEATRLQLNCHESCGRSASRIEA
jgi:hypothetical protein